MNKQNLRPIDKAVEMAGGTGRGSKARASRAFGISHSYLCKILREGRVPSEQCLAIQNAVNGEVTCHDLRPDIFGPPPIAKAS